MHLNNRILKMFKMKIIINKPCSEKLSQNNYCSKCDHQIPDLSALSKSDAINKIKENNITCGIFNEDLLKDSNPLKSIYNIIALSAIGFLTPQVNAMDTVFKDDLNSNQTIKIQKKQITFRLNSSSIQNEETFRLLINNKVVLAEMNANQDYIINFDIEKNATIEIRIASNLFAEDLVKNYQSDQLPNKVILSREKFNPKPIVMGKIIMKPEKN